MKNLIFAVLFIVTGLVSITGSKSKIENVQMEIMECDYWNEIVYIDDEAWLYEYCGDKLITATPIIEED
jgi:hypothetical protein